MMECMHTVPVWAIEYVSAVLKGNKMSHTCTYVNIPYRPRKPWTTLTNPNKLNIP